MDFSQIQALLAIVLISLSFFTWLGLVCFQAGMVRTKNTTTQLLKNMAALFILVLIMTLLYPAPEQLISGQNNTWWTDIFAIAEQSIRTVPQQLGHDFAPSVLAIMQVMPAALAACTISGATAERAKLWPFLLFIILFAVVIYAIQVQWFWRGGWFYQIGFIDQAGAGLVFLTAAIAGGVGAKLLGPRLNRYVPVGIMPIRASNLPFVAIGSLLFLLGCVGFLSCVMVLNGQIFQSGALVGLSTKIFCAYSASFLAALLLARIFSGAADLTLAVNGGFGGIAALAADPTHFGLKTTIVLGFIAGSLVILAVRACDRWRLDDPSGVVPAFAAGGIVGCLGCSFAQDYAALSLQFGRDWSWFNQLFIQFAGMLVIVVWVTLMSLLAWWLLRLIVGIRINPEQEIRGLDVYDCGMSAYPEFTHQDS